MLRRGGSALTTVRQLDPLTESPPARDAKSKPSPLLASPSLEVIKAVIERYLRMEDSGSLQRGAVAGAVWSAFLHFVTHSVFAHRPVDKARVSRDYTIVR